MIRYILCLLLLTIPAAAVEWGDTAKADLHWGEKLRLEDYTLEVADFTPEEKTPPQVMLNLFEDKDRIATRALEAGEEFTIDDKVRVQVMEIERGDWLEDENREPSVAVRIQTRTIPELYIYLITDKDTYEPDQDVKFQLGVENRGLAKAEDIKIELSSDPTLIDSEYTKSSLAPGEIWDDKPATKEEIDPIEFKLKAPSPPEPIDFKVTAHACYLDSEGDPLESWGGTLFSVFGPLKIDKYAEENQKLGEKSYVHITLRNCGKTILKIELKDSTCRNFETDSSLKWNFEILPGKTETVSYQIEPKDPGDGQILPSAEATYQIDRKTYKATSSSPVIDVLGPQVEAKKSASSKVVELGETVVMTLELKNTGNQRTRITLNEEIPSWAEFLEGKTTISQVLLPEEVAILEYSITSWKSGKFEVPPTNIYYLDSEGTLCTTDTSRLKITFKDATEEEKETALEKAEDNSGAAMNSDGSGVTKPEDKCADEVEKKPKDIVGSEDPEFKDKIEVAIKDMIKNGTESAKGISEARNMFVWGLLAVILTIYLIFSRYL